MAENILETRTINDINVEGNRFFIPDYQRGYRWTETEVTALLEDILAHMDKNSARNYCLQPVVVAQRDDGSWEVIDGQQRLTTIYIILRYLSPQETAFSIELSTRKDSEQFLLNLSSADPDVETDIDSFHIASAWKTVEAWFQVREVGRKSLKKKYFIALSENVEVIWYDVRDDVPHIDIFTRLNIGKISLTNAELTKALFLNAASSLVPEDLGLTAEALQNKIVVEAQAEAAKNRIAMQWDTIEQALHDDRFWLYLNQKDVEEANRIDFLFRFFYELDTGSRPRDLVVFHYFEDKVNSESDAFDRAVSLWDEIREHLLRLQEWYDNRELYHLTGYLITTGHTLAELYSEAQGKKKSAFKEELIKRIVTNIQERIGQRTFPDLNYNESGDYKLITDILLLFNVIISQLSSDPDERFSFMQYKRQRWSLEHIHAQNSEKLSNDRERRRWLEDHQRILEAMVEGDNNDTIATVISAVASLLGEKSLTDRFEDVHRQVVGILSEEGDSNEVHGIANLALLDRETNSQLKNAVFAVKRRLIIDRDRDGHYVLPGTRNVFLKYYSGDVDHMFYWTATDRDKYTDAIVAVLSEYFGTDILGGET